MMAIPVIVNTWHYPFRHAFWLTTINNLKLHINFYIPLTSIIKRFMVYSKTFSSFKINMGFKWNPKPSKCTDYCSAHYTPVRSLTDRHNHETAQICLDSLPGFPCCHLSWNSGFFCCCLLFVHGKKCYLSPVCYFFRTFWMRTCTFEHLTNWNVWK